MTKFVTKPNNYLSATKIFLTIFLILPIFFTIARADISFEVSYENFPTFEEYKYGEIKYIKEIRYGGYTYISTSSVQKIDIKPMSFISFRTKNTTSGSLKLGFELGISQALQENINSFYLAATSPTYPSEIVAHNSLDPYFATANLTYEESNKISIIPILFSVEYNLFNIVNFSVYVGEYLLSVSKTQKEVREYLYGSQAGEIEKRVYYYNYLLATPGAEFGVGMNFNLNNAWSLMLNGKGIYIMKIRELNFYSINDTKLSYDKGFEFGGYGYAVGVNLVFRYGNPWILREPMKPKDKKTKMIEKRSKPRIIEEIELQLQKEMEK
ncbi:MAG: hypothetical protein SNJ64_01985 [Endomicrobiia bacterium]